MAEWLDVADDFSRFLLTHGKTPDSAHGYVWHTRIFWHWATKRKVDPACAEHDTVERFLADQLARLSPMTAYNRLMSVRCWFHSLIMEGHRPDNPTEGLRVKKPKRQPVQPFSLKEMRTLLNGCLTVRDRAIVMVLADTGMRLGELLSLKCQDVNWTNGNLRLYGKGQKERWVSLGTDSLRELRAVIGRRKNGPIWLTNRNTPLKAQQCRKNLYTIAARSGVAHTFPHRFRSTFANFFLEAGGDLGALQSVLGHSDITTTAHYAGYSRAKRGMDQMRKLDLGGQLAG